MKWQKRLSFRREPTPSQERECLEDVQKLLVDAEEKRTKTFHNSLRLLEFDFLQAESDRNFPEKTRQTDFSKTQSERREKFVADEADRLASFKDADAEQEKIFSISEERRLSTFNSVQSSRKTAMHQIVETQQIQNDWAITLVKTLYVEGHQSREALCKETLAAVSNDFASFLQAAHSSFSATQSRRINAVKGTHPPSHTISEDHEQPKLDLKFIRRPQRGYSGDSTICASEYRRSFNSRRESALATVQGLAHMLKDSDTDAKEPCPLATEQEIAPTGIEEHPSTTAATPPQAVSKPSKLAPQPSVGSVSTQYKLPPVILPIPSSNTAHTDDHDVHVRLMLVSAHSQYRHRETLRNDQWGKILGEYEETYRASEAKRALARGQRDEDFDVAERAFESRFNSKLASFEAHFEEREDSRDGAEAHRDHEFKALLDSLARGLDRLLLMFSKQATTLEDSENHAFVSILDLGNVLFREMDHVVFDTRRHFNERFTEAFQAHGITVSVPIIQCPARQDDDDLGVIGVEPKSLISRAATTKATNNTTMPAKSKFESKGSVKKNNSGSHVPANDSHHIQERSQTLDTVQLKEQARGNQELPECTVNEYLEDSYYRFKKAEESRRNMAIDCFEKWQQEFALNERKRRKDSGLQQTRHEKRVKQREAHQSSSFLNAQEERAKVFQAGESSRETTFWTKELTRSHEWDEALSKESDLNRVRDDAVREARIGESARERGFTGWAISVREDFTRRVEVWKKEFAQDEWNREQSFMDSVGLRGDEEYTREANRLSRDIFFPGLKSV